MASLTPFHVAVPVRDIGEARRFYGELLGFAEGRSDDRWIDFNMYGHQFVVHLDETWTAQRISNPVDGHDVPVPHCGVVLNISDWETLRERVVDVIDSFVIEPHTRFEGQAGEQRTMFFLDPSGNALEFKAFKNIADELFRS